jgi:hypothetical protein
LATTTGKVGIKIFHKGHKVTRRSFKNLSFPLWIIKGKSFLDNIETQRKFLNKQQTQLRQIMMAVDRHDEAVELFLVQHAMLHSANVAQTGLWSYEDAVLDGMPSEWFRRVPPKDGHSVAWMVWHMARCEDITMNLLVAGTPQVMNEGDWPARLKIAACDTGNAMDAAEIAGFSAAIDIDALRGYRVAVGRRTREIVAQLQPGDLQQKVDPARLQQVRAEGAVVEAAWGIAEYWGKRNVAGLLLMPATRHNLVHLNEILKLK